MGKGNCRGCKTDCKSCGSTGPIGLTLEALAHHGTEGKDYQTITDLAMKRIHVHALSQLAARIRESGPLATVNRESWLRLDDATAYAVLTVTLRDRIEGRL